MADQLAELSLRFGPRRDETAAEAQARLRLLMEDVSSAIDGDALRAAVREGVKVWKFMPTCAEVCEAAYEFIAERRADRRIGSIQRLAAPEIPPLIPAMLAEMARAKAEAFGLIDAASIAMTGRSGPRMESQRKPVDDTPLRTPTEQDYAEIRAALDARHATEDAR